ncbi:MAG: oligosaccharide flippase family protein [Actinomycetota bacterium]
MINTAKLGGALVIAWMFALVGRFLLPRVLGPDRFGDLAVTESGVVLAMSLVAFGVGDHISKVVSNDRTAADTFARPIFLLQLGAGGVVTIIAAVVAGVVGGAEFAVLAATFGVAQVATVLGRTTADYLQAIHEAGAVSASSIVTKAIWLAVLLAGLGAGAELLALPLALVVSEVIRTAWLLREYRRRFGTPPAAPWSAARRVLRASIPHYITTLNVEVLSSSTRIIVGAMGGAVAAGLFASAAVASAVPMLLTPVLGWVAIPVLSNLRERNVEEMWTRVGSITDLLFVACVAPSIVMFAWSDQLMDLLFGADFELGGPAFAWLAATIPATYFTQLVGSAYVADHREWTNTKVNLWTMLLVVVGSIGAIWLAGGDEPAVAATWAAVVIAVGEWVTVVALIVLRPFPTLGRATVVRAAVLAAAVVAAAVDKLGDGDVTLRVVAAALAGIVALSDVRRVLAGLRSALGDR